MVEEKSFLVTSPTRATFEEYSKKYGIVYRASKLVIIEYQLTCHDKKKSHHEFMVMHAMHEFKSKKHITYMF
jgi:hypothetical protein